LIDVVDSIRVVTVCVVGGVVVDAVVLDSPGFQMLKVQNVTSVILIDSGPVLQKRIRDEQVESLLTYSLHTTKFNTT
jgi:hypothetical protein